MEEGSRSQRGVKTLKLCLTKGKKLPIKLPCTLVIVSDVLLWFSKSSSFAQCQPSSWAAQIQTSSVHCRQQKYEENITFPRGGLCVTSKCLEINIAVKEERQCPSVAFLSFAPLPCSILTSPTLPLLLHPFFLEFPPPKPHTPSPSLICYSTCCLFVLRPCLVPLLRGQPRCARDNGMNAGMINPRGCCEKTQERVSQGDNTLFSRACVGGAGIMVLHTGFADLRLLSEGWGVYTGRCHGCQGAAEQYSHICLA